MHCVFLYPTPCKLFPKNQKAFARSVSVPYYSQDEKEFPKWGRAVVGSALGIKVSPLGPHDQSFMLPMRTEIQLPFFF